LGAATAMVGISSSTICAAAFRTMWNGSVSVQVKEKFGTLRFYIDGGDEEVYGMIKMAECMSRNVCEITGDIGSNNVWIWATRSPECGGKPTEDQMNRVLNIVNQIESVKNNDI